MSSFIFTVSRLWNYLNIYFLKPFDAVNDTLTATLIRKFNWNIPYLEIGSGDGVFSYVMHGGKFPVWFDRYIDVNLKNKDIFDTHDLVNGFDLKKIKKIRNLCSVDSKENHVKKIKEIGFADKAILSEYENLPFKNESFESIFLYTPHGLHDYDKCIKECNRALTKKGYMIVLNYNQNIKNYFVCHKLYTKLKGTFKRYFKKLDNGRHDEITNLSKSLDEWRLFFRERGFKIIKYYEGLSPIAWIFYDIQTRPFLKPLIKFFNFFPKSFRTILKLIWMLVWYPILLGFYFFFSNIFIKSKKNCYYSFLLQKI